VVALQHAFELFSGLSQIVRWSADGWDAERHNRGPDATSLIEQFGARLVRSLINNFNPQLIALDA
jgi:hypothetical protein